MELPMTDAVIIGAGPNGLVAANLLADAGWTVTVLEAQSQPGGAVRSGDYLGPGYTADFCSAFYPLTVASPVISAFRLEEHGLVWRHAPAVLANPLLDGRCPVLWPDEARTAEGLEALGPGDGEAWSRLCGLWRELGPHFIEALFTPFPPVRAGLRLANKLRAAGSLRAARLAVLPIRRLAEEEFSGPGCLLMAGCALHADLAPESVLSTFYGWLLAMLAHGGGWPVPQGGAGQLTAALVRRLEARGGQVVCDAEVTEVVVREGVARAARTADGREVEARRAVLADVTAPVLYGGLVGWEHLPVRLRDDMHRFQWDFATVKVDWALSGPVPWAAAGAAQAGTVHLSAGMDEMTEYAAQLAMGQVPAHPFVLMGQMAKADPTRSPPGTETLWGYTHVPRQVRGDAGGAGLQGRWDYGENEAMADRLEAQVERFAPGFRDMITHRYVFGPHQIHAHNANSDHGAIGGGTAALHQQLVFRPTPGLGRPETPVKRLYLASASAHPGGGVHGACGANAARAALHQENPLRRWLISGWLSAAQRRSAGPDENAEVRTRPHEVQP